MRCIINYDILPPHRYDLFHLQCKCFAKMDFMLAIEANS